MNVRHVEISMGRTVKTAEFESFSTRITMGVEYEDGEYNEEEYDKFRDKVHKKLMRQIERVLPFDPE